MYPCIHVSHFPPLSATLDMYHLCAVCIIDSIPIHISDPHPARCKYFPFFIRRKNIFKRFEALHGKQRVAICVLLLGRNQKPNLFHWFRFNQRMNDLAVRRIHTGAQIKFLFKINVRRETKSDLRKNKQHNQGALDTPVASHLFIQDKKKTYNTESAPLCFNISSLSLRSTNPATHRSSHAFCTVASELI